MKKTGSDHGAPAEPLERVRLQAEVAKQRVRIAKDELKRARKRLKEAKRADGSPGARGTRRPAASPYPSSRARSASCAAAGREACGREACGREACRREAWGREACSREAWGREACSRETRGRETRATRAACREPPPSASPPSGVGWRPGGAVCCGTTRIASALASARISACGRNCHRAHRHSRHRYTRTGARGHARAR